MPVPAPPSTSLPIAFLAFDRRKLTPREAQFLEALIWVAAEAPRAAAAAQGYTLEAAALFGAQFACAMLAPRFPDLNIHLHQPRPLTTQLPSDPGDPSDPDPG
jgi:hypothetical protein